MLHDHGLNYARIRVWVDSPMATMAKRKSWRWQNGSRRIRSSCSLTFITPIVGRTGKQPKPAGWADLDFAGLKKALYDHTYEICSSLKEQGTPPDMVQIGNEINNGMFWPDGNSNNWDNLAALLKEGFRAVKELSPSTQVMLHLKAVITSYSAGGSTTPSSAKCLLI